MSEIDRIAEDLTEWIASHFDGLSDAATETKVRAALLEYGQIVREEVIEEAQYEVSEHIRPDSRVSAEIYDSLQASIASLITPQEKT